jgi:hypothetical protein
LFTFGVKVSLDPDLVILLCIPSGAVVYSGLLRMWSDRGKRHTQVTAPWNFFARTEVFTMKADHKKEDNYEET